MAASMWARCCMCGGPGPCGINGSNYCVLHVLEGIDVQVIQESLDKGAPPEVANHARKWVRELFTSDPEVQRKLKAIWN